MFLESLVYCRKEKGLNIHAWVLMSNHVHLIISSKTEGKLADVIRDLKKYTSYKILREIKESTTESRKEWMLNLFGKAGRQNSNNTNYQFWRQDNHPIDLDGHGDMFEQRLN
jgi:REP element-mobilizing transposase RayT